MFSYLGEVGNLAVPIYRNTFEALALETEEALSTRHKHAELPADTTEAAPKNDARKVIPDAPAPYRPVRSATGMVFELGDPATTKLRASGQVNGSRDGSLEPEFPPPVWEAIAEIDPDLLPRHMSNDDIFYDETAVTGSGSTVSVLPSAVIHVPEVSTNNYSGPDVETYLRLGGGYLYNQVASVGTDETVYTTQSTVEINSNIDSAWTSADSTHIGTPNDSTAFDSRVNTMFETFFNTVYNNIPQDLSNLDASQKQQAQAAFQSTDHEPAVAVPLGTETGWMNVTYGPHLTMAMNPDDNSAQQGNMAAGDITSVASGAQNLVSGDDLTLLSGGDHKVVTLGSQRHFVIGDNTGIVFGGDILYVVGDTNENHLKDTTETFYGKLTEVKYDKFTETNEADVEVTNKGSTTETFEGSVTATFKDTVDETFKGVVTDKFLDSRYEYFTSFKLTAHTSMDMEFWLGISIQISLSAQFDICLLLKYELTPITIEQKALKSSSNGIEAEQCGGKFGMGGLFVKV